MEAHFAREAFMIATDGKEQKKLSISETEQILEKLGLTVNQHKWAELKDHTDKQNQNTDIGQDDFCKIAVGTMGHNNRWRLHICAPQTIWQQDLFSEESK